MSSHPLVIALEEAVQQARVMDAPLRDRLQLVADRVRSLSDLFADAVERMISRQQEGGAGSSAPAPGDLMPSFLLPDDQGVLVSLEGLLRQGPVVISFNRGHWCPYCRLNAMALSQIDAAVRAEGATLVAITPERRKFTQAMKSDSDATFPILSDMDNGYALSLNLAIWVGSEMEQLIDGAGWKVPHYQGNSGWMLPIPATFVIASNGVITARYLDPDYRMRMEIDDLILAVRSIPANPIPANRGRAIGSAA